MEDTLLASTALSSLLQLVSLAPHTLLMGFLGRKDGLLPPGMGSRLGEDSLPRQEHGHD